MRTIAIGKHELIARVDDDFIMPAGCSLNVNSCGYVRLIRYLGVSAETGKPVYSHEYLHRLISGAPEGKVVLFLDRDRLNLQRENLLVCDRAVSIRNTGGRKGRFKGVHFSKKQGRWVAQITFNYRCHTIGSFDEEDHAAQAYNHAAVRLYGPHAYVNLMPEDARGF
jgi:hypothetical protein